MYVVQHFLLSIQDCVIIRSFAILKEIPTVRKSTLINQFTKFINTRIYTFFRSSIRSLVAPRSSLDSCKINEDQTDKISSVLIGLNFSFPTGR